MSNSVNNYVNHLVAYYQTPPTPVSSTKDAIWTPPMIPVFGYGWPQTTQVIFANTQQDRDDQRQTSAAMIGGIATILFAGLSARALKQYRNDSKELAGAKITFQHLLSNFASGQEVALRPIWQKHIEILEAKCSRARHIALFVGGIFAAASAAFIGGMFAVNWLISSSIVSAVAIAAIGGFDLVWHWDDEYSLPLAMQRELQVLHNI
jgi:hypothetical protein